MSKTRLAPGVWRDDYGIEARVELRGTRRLQRFPAPTALETITRRTCTDD